MSENRHPLAHQFLKWFPTAVGAAGVAIAAVWPEARDWVSEQAAWAWNMLSDPVIAFGLLLAIAAYIWAIIYTGQPQEAKTGLAAIKPMTRRQRRADDELRRKIADASPDEAKRLIEAEIAKLNAPKKTVWERAQELVDPAQQGSFLRILTKQNERAAIGMAKTTFEAEAAKAAQGPDFPEIGKAILDRYKGEAAVFPYRKAVLQVTEVKATASRHAGAASLSNIGCHIDLENGTKQPFKECRIRLVSINGDAVDGDSFLRIGPLRGGKAETVFTTYHHSKKRINFMKRDLEDVVSNPPFLLCLDDRDLPLSDGKEYHFVFALECEYEHPTYAKVRCFIPEREKIEIELVAQSLDNPDEQE